MSWIQSSKESQEKDTSRLQSGIMCPGVSIILKISMREAFDLLVILLKDNIWIL